MKNIKFAFGIDGTVTSQETLPLVALFFGVQEEIAELIIESFIKHMHIFPASE